MDRLSGPALVLFVASLLGAYAGLFLPVSAALFVGGGLVAGAAALLSSRRGLAVGALFVATLCAVAAAAAHARADHQQHRPALDAGPEVYEGIVDDVFTARHGGRTLILDAHTAKANEAVRLRLHVDAPLDRIALRAGDEIRVRVTPRRFSPRDRPGTFDADLYALARGYDARGGVYRDTDIAVMERQAASRYFANARAFMRTRLLGLLTPREAGVVLALIVGDTALFDEDQLSTYRDIGAGHLLAVSGLQVSLLALIFFYLAQSLLLLTAWGRRHAVQPWAAAASLIAVALFVLLCGAPPSCVRAGLMASAVLAGSAAGRRITGVNALSLAGFVTVAFSPTSVVDPSFLLSYAAVLGLLLAAPAPLQAARPRAWRWAAAALVPTFGAGALTLAISAHLFGALAPGGILANVLLVPVATVLQVPAIFLGLIGALTNTALPAELGAASAGLLEAITFGLADIMGGVVDVPAPSGWATLGLLITAALLVAAATQRRAGSALLALGVLVVTLTPALLPQGGVRVDTLPVGQGDSHLVRFESGSVMLIDGGGVWDESRAPGRDVVVPYLKAHHIGRIDVMVLSHPDPDHVLGLLDVLDSVDVVQIWHAGYTSEHPLARRLLEKAALLGVPVKTPRDLPASVAFGESHVDILAPFPEDGSTLYDELSPNENSFVIRVSHGASAMLFAGDLERWGERYLMEQREDLRADVLKAPHHGSRTSSSEAFIDAVAPHHVIYATGRGNQFGFPHAEVDARYVARGVERWDTARHGLVRVQLEDSGVSVMPFHPHPSD